MEIDVWDGDAPSDSDDSSSSEDEKDGKEGKKPGLKARLKAKLGRKNSTKAGPKKEKEPQPPATTDGAASSEMPKPWRANSNRAEPKVYHGMETPAFVSDAIFADA